MFFNIEKGIVTEIITEMKDYYALYSIIYLRN